MKAQKPWTWPHFHLSSETLVEWAVCWEVLLLSPPGPPESSPAVWDVSQTRWSSLWFDWDWVEPLVCPHWAFSWVMRKQLVHFEESFGGCLGPLVVYVPRHCSEWHWVSWNVCEGGTLLDSRCQSSCTGLTPSSQCPLNTLLYWRISMDIWKQFTYSSFSKIINYELRHFFRVLQIHFLMLVFEVEITS